MAARKSPRKRGGGGQRIGTEAKSAMQAADDQLRKGELAAAEKTLQRLRRAAPGSSDVWHRLGLIAYQRGHYQAAVELLRRAVSLRRDFAEAHSMLGLALQAAGSPQEAVQAAERAVNLRPEASEPYINLASALRSLGRSEQAVAACYKGLRIKPDSVELLNNLANALSDQSSHEAAARVLAEAIRLHPGSADLHLHRGASLAKLQRFQEAKEEFQRTLRLRSESMEATEALLDVKRATCDWAGAQDLELAVLRGVEAGRGCTKPLGFLSLHSTTQQQAECARQYAMAVSSSVAGLSTGLLQEPERRERIRLGYMSADYRDHPTPYLVRGLLASHDRSQFEVIAYSIGPDDGSEGRRVIEEASDRFVDLADLSSVEAAERIAGDEVDVLVDLMGYTRYARPEILACRPAPVQVNYLGYPNTMGAAFMDYLIADPVVLPAEDASCYTESVAYLPGCYAVQDRERGRPMQLPTRDEVGLPEGAFVFCCFNNGYKITPEVFDVWMRILHRVPGSILWLIEWNADLAVNLRAEAHQRGIDANRIVLAPRVPREEHLARYTVADLALDTLPYGAHATGSDALWMGCPLLTCTGETFASRVAASELHAVGLPELIATSLDSYEARAVELATDTDDLAAIRRRLAENLESYPLFDTRRVTAWIEEAYQAMVAQALDGVSSGPIVVDRGRKPIA